MDAGLSADGYAATSVANFDWPEVGDEGQRFFIDELVKMGTFAYGANVYGWMASWWPNVESVPDAGELDIEYGKLWVPMPKVVFSTTMESADWNTTVVGGDLAREDSRLRERSLATLRSLATRRSPTHWCGRD